MPSHPHLIVPGGAETRQFTSPKSGPRERMRLPARNRAAHAQRLIRELEQIAPQAQQRAEEQRAQGIDAGVGIYLVFESEPSFELKFESLDFNRSGIELCAVRRMAENRMQATVFVPDGKLAFFLKRIEAYRDAETRPRGEGPSRPKNQDLVESISHIRLAALEALGRPLTTFGDTSAAAADAARMAAALWAKYPGFTPETIRALMVHASDWTPAMHTRVTGPDGAVNYETLLRCFGYGVPSFNRLMSSADNALTLIVQDDIQPFFRKNSTVKTREMRLHALPWPVDILQELQDAPVRMRVTLSYFIEPSPGARGWTSKYGYQSFGLRFAVKTALERSAAFEDRINKNNRDDDYEAPRLKDTGHWTFGYPGRSLVTLGSVHSDIWTGTAADLAAREHIAVFPTIGWWNKRQHLGAWEKQARYSLIVSIETPESDVDIYTPVANEIGVPVVVET